MVAAGACARIAAEVSRLPGCVRGAGNGSVSFSGGRLSFAIDADRSMRGRPGCTAG